MAATDVQHDTAGSDQSPRTTPTVVLPHQPRPRERVEQVLRTLPSHGWTAGWIGRRDRALLVLCQIAGLSYENAAAMTAGDLHVADGAATIRTPGGKTTLRDVPDDLLCGPCALARWVHALDLTVVYPDGRVIATVIARAVPLTPDSPHLCHSTNTITDITRRAPLLPPIDRWGHPTPAGQPSTLHWVRTPATTRRAFAPVHHTPPGPPSSAPEIAHRARALQIRVEQLLDRTA